MTGAAQVSPFATVVLDGSGNGQISIGPPSGTRWDLNLVTLAVSSSTKQPQGFLYRGSASGPLELVDSTYTGAQASSSLVAGTPFFAGQRLWAVWKGGDAGAVATLQAFGQQGSRSAPFADSPSPGAGFANPVVAGTALLVPAINSPGFATGSTGWSINRDGSAEFNNIVIRNGSVVSGTALYYNGTPAAGNLVASISATAGTDAFGNAYPAGIAVTAGSGTAGQVIVGTTSANPTIQFKDPTGVSDALMQVRYNALATSPTKMNITGLDELEVDGKLTALVGVYAQNPATGDPEIWHSLTLQNGWTNTSGFAAAQYRLLAGPPNSVEVVGEITAGTTANGTVIGTLPTGYRPTHTIRAPVYAFGASLNVSTETPGLDVNSDGTIKTLGLVNAGNVGFHLFVPLDA